MRVAIYAIAKNEEKFARRWLETVRGADTVTVLDTGSTDNTVDMLYRGIARVYRGSIEPFRFDDARNAALALVPHDIDICVALDIDETLRPGWREALEKAWVPGTTSAWVTFHFNPEMIFLQNNRVHARHGYRWKYPCHEGLYPDRITTKSVDAPDCVLEHWPDTTKPRPDYLALLRLGLDEYPDDPRMLFYYGRELYFRQEYKAAVLVLNRYLTRKVPPVPWERDYATRYIAECIKAA